VNRTPSPPTARGPGDSAAADPPAGDLYEDVRPPAQQAWLAGQWAAKRKAPLLWVLDGPRSLDLYYRDLQSLHPDLDALCYGAWDTWAGDLPDEGATAVRADRLRLLQRLGQGDRPPAVIATCVQALMQKILPPGVLAAATRTVAVGDEVEPLSLAEHLESVGYTFTPEVQQAGQASLRGGLLDAWSPDQPWPARLEFFGAQVDSIRRFDPFEQRSVDRVASVRLSPAGERCGEDGVLFGAYLPPAAAWVWSDGAGLREHAGLAWTDVVESEATVWVAPWEEVAADITARIGEPWSLSAPQRRGGRPPLPDLQPVIPLAAFPGEGWEPELLTAERRRYVAELERQAAAGWRVQVYFDTEGGRDRFTEEVAGPAGSTALDLRVAPLSAGFRVPARRLACLAEGDIYGRRKEHPGRYAVRRREDARKYRAREHLEAWSDLQPGDLVVHMDHGIGRYLGLYAIDFHGRNQEVFALEYADGARLYVPTGQAHLLSRYMGVGRRRAELHKLGGRRWQRERAAAERAVVDLASSLLETQAAREALTGRASPPDTPWQREFEATFPYQETEDQLRVMEEVRADMESDRPMDRLICGDVGYGKTEIAMRAAFKAVMGGAQVAILVPTTVLAQQHYETFSERMAPFPVRIEMLSRFRARGQQDDSVAGLKTGAVDIVIGTHRLVQPDVAFRNLGLVIIDEEQRFGVEHKERLKQLRRLVDVLTLTATPIPRTLYMSLVGTKELSAIQTAPRDRLPVTTHVAAWTDSLVRHAILRELNREGQVFVLHNRVMTLDHVCRRLQELVPEARVAPAHGQMRERELAGVMRRFTRGEIDVLLCTTIIESGVDIPNVNTLIIDRADRFGLADLYQLRGRVGRGDRAAYAYLLLPPDGQLHGTARSRIQAIQQYGGLGAGFKLALHDLELRGAGNLLGPEQSGHIAAIGFGLYCQLLKRTVAQLKGEDPAPLIAVELTFDFLDLSPRARDSGKAAMVPYDYIEDENLRLSFYRRLAAVASEKERKALRAEWSDRFGKLPPPVDRLFRIAGIRLRAARLGIDHLETRGDRLMLQRGGDYLRQGDKFIRLVKPGATPRLNEISRHLDALIQTQK